MAECPFCGSQVSEELVTYGGTCPKCFAEIPGEEAATDPGVEVKAAQERKDRQWATFRMVASLSALSLVVGCTGLLALATLLWPEPQAAAMLDFDALGFPVPEIVGVEEQELADASGAATRRSGSRSSNNGSSEKPIRAISGASSEVGSAEEDLPRVRTELGPLGAPARPTGTGRTGGPPGVAGLAIDMPTVRRDDNVVLSDPDAIRDMIGERLVEFIPALKVCYDRRLKLNPTLKGRWRLKFTVQPSGQVSDISAEPLERSDRELERCVVEHIDERWRFGKITLAQPVSRTLRFYPE